MVIRYDSVNVYIEADDDELDYFMHRIGADMLDVESLSQTDINALAEVICAESFEKLGEDSPLVQHISDDWADEALAVELLKIDGGVQLKVCPLSKYNGPDKRYFDADTKLPKPNKNKDTDIDDVRYSKQIQELLTKDEKMKEFLTEDITEEFIDSTINEYLTTIYTRVPTMPIEAAVANLLKSELCYSYIAKGLESAVSQNDSTDMAEKTRQLLIEFIERVKTAYSQLKIETFYKVNCLGDALKAMCYVESGCIIKIKETYYLVTDKDNMIFSDFGNKVDKFCYADDSIICKIKDGYFASTKNEEKKEER